MSNEIESHPDDQEMSKEPLSIEKLGETIAWYLKDKILHNRPGQDMVLSVYPDEQLLKCLSDGELTIHIRADSLETIQAARISGHAPAGHHKPKFE